MIWAVIYITERHARMTTARLQSKIEEFIIRLKTRQIIRPGLALIPHPRPRWYRKRSWIHTWHRSNPKRNNNSGEQFILTTDSLDSAPATLFQALTSWLNVLGPVHTSPDRFENAKLSLRIFLPSTRIRWIRIPKTQTFENSLQNGNFWNANLTNTCRRGKRNLRERWRHGSCPANMAPDRRISVDEALVYFGRAFGKPCSVSRYLFKLCPSEARDNKAKHIKAIFNASVEDFHWSFQRGTKQE